MIVLILERVKPSLRGEITRWLLEAKAGVFVGHVNAMVREKLWQKVCQDTGDGAAMIIWTTNNEQGYQFDFWSDTSRHVHDWEGLQLITRPRRSQNTTGGTTSAPEGMDTTKGEVKNEPPETDPDFGGGEFHLSQ